MVRALGSTARGAAKRARLLLAVGASVVCSLVACGEGPTAPPSSDPAGTGWETTVLIGTRDGPGRMLLLGRHRVDNDGRSYEASLESTLVDETGAVRPIEPPPLASGLTAGDGAVVGDSAYVMVTDCSAGGDPSSGGFSCLDPSHRSRFLRYDVPEDAWVELPLPPGLDPSLVAHPVLIPGQSSSGDLLYFGLPSEGIPSLTERFAAFDPSNEEWFEIARGRPGLGPACVDGSSIFYLDVDDLIANLTALEGEAPQASPQQLPASVVIATPDHSRTEQVELPYRTRFGSQPVDALGITPHCLGGGQVLISVGINHEDRAVPWLLRTGDDQWRSIRLPPELARPGPWIVEALPGRAVFYVQQLPDPSSSLDGVVYRSEADAWAALPALPPVLGPLASAPLGDTEVVYFRRGTITPATTRTVQVP